MVMVRARMARLALAAALGVACGCSSVSSCSSCPGESFTSRLTSLFRRDRGVPVEVVGEPAVGPVIADPGIGPGPGPYEGPGCAPLPQSVAPPLFPPPNEAHRMPYQPPGQ
jgi:hypothetical protein